MLTGNGRDGLSWETAYGVENKTDYENIDTYAAGTFFEFVADVDYAGATHPRLFWSGLNVDWNGFKVFGVNGLSSIDAIQLRGGTVLKNVWMDGAFSNGGGSASLLEVDNGIIYGCRVDGSVTGSTDAGIFTIIKGTAVADVQTRVVSDTLINADIASGTGVSTLILGAQSVSIDHFIFTGTLSTTSGTTIFSNSSSVIAYNSFYNSDLNGTIGANGGYGRTTAELQDIRTYTDGTYNPDLFSPFFDMVRISSFTGAETWTIADSDGVEYPKLGFQTTILVPKATFTDKIGSPIVGGHVLWIEETAFAANNPSWNSPVIVSSTGTTDANGEVSYTGTVDPAKVYTAVLRDYEYVNGAWEKSQGSDSGQQNVDLTAPA